MVVKYGIENCSIKRIAEACGVSVATLYIYYKDKEDLLVQIAKEELNKRDTILLDGVDDSLPFKESLWLVWQTMAIAGNKDRIATEFINIMRHSSFASAIFKDQTNKFHDALKTILKKAIDEGQIRTLPYAIFWALATLSN